jgi:hypothetical protein
MAEGKHYAILRTEKIKTWKHLAAVGKHNNRLIPANTVPGAMPPTELVPGPDDLTERVRARHKKLGVAHEKGKVLAIEVLMTASPGWWAAADNWQKKEFFEQSAKSLHDEFGKGVVSISVHTDESTPHIQAVVVPVYQDIVKKRGRKPKTPEGIAKRAREEAAAPQIWRISYDKIFGGRPEVLADYQTEYHSYVRRLGLARGEDTVGEGIKHTTLKDYAKHLKAKEDRLAASVKQLVDERDEFEEDKLFFKASSERLIDDLRTHSADKAQLDARERKLNERAHELDEREESLKKLAQGTANREANAQRCFAEAEAKESAVALRTEAVEAGLRNIAVRETALLKSELSLEERAAQLGNAETAMAGREDAVDIRETQISIIADMASGKGGASWKRGEERPTMAAETDEQTRAAVAAAWPEKLRLAGIAIATMVARRSRIAKTIARVRRALRLARMKMDQVKLREEAVQRNEADLQKRERVADGRDAEAEKQTETANALLAAGERSKAEAATERVNLAAHRKTAEDAIRALRDETSVARADRAQAVRDEQLARAQTASARGELAGVIQEKNDARAEIEGLRAKKEDLVKKLSNLTGSVTQLSQDKAVLSEELLSLQAERQALALSQTNLLADQKQLEIDRKSFKTEEAKSTRARELIMGVFDNQHSLEAGRESFVLKPHDPSQRSQLIDESEVPTWFRPLVQTIARIQHTIIRAEDAETAFLKAKVEVLKHYPIQEQELAEKIPSPPPVRNLRNQRSRTDPSLGL